MANPRNPRGCFMVQGALACSDTADSIRREMAKRRAAGEALLRQRFERAISEGDLPKDFDAADLARYVTTVTYRIAVQAAGGATRDELNKVAEMVLRTWPT